MDVELDQRRMAVLRDLVGVAVSERRANTLNSVQFGDPGDDVGRHDVEREHLRVGVFDRRARRAEVSSGGSVQVMCRSGESRLSLAMSSAMSSRWWSA